MKSMRSFFVLCLSTFAFATIFSSVAQADWDSFRRTCQVIYEDHRLVQANCRDVSGVYRYNSFDKSRCEPGTISNQNGRLACVYMSHGGGGHGGGHGGGGWRLPSGSYSRSCVRCDVRRDILSCDCRTISGRYVRASLNMRSCGNYAAGNQNGRLVCE